MKHPSIHLQKSLTQNIVDILHFYNQQAIIQLERKTNIHDRIHQTRLCCKRIRSVLRLGRFSLENDVYKHYNAYYRDLSAQFSTIRDCTALSETITSLLHANLNGETKNYLMYLKNSLVRQKGFVIRSDEFLTIKEKVKAAFIEKSNPIVNLQLSGEQGEIYGKGIQRIYERGVKFWKINVDSSDNHSMHEWRKQVKYLWYQVVIISPVWQEMLTPLARQLQILSKLLGEYQDLAVFEFYLKDLKTHKKDKIHIRILERHCRQKKNRLQKESLYLGNKIFSLPKGISGTFVANLFHEVNK